MSVADAIRKRRSIRLFKNEKISRDKMNKILDAGRWAPTGCNKQLFEIISIEEPNLRRQVARLSNNQIYFHQAPVVVLVLYDTSKELVPEGVAPDVPALSVGAFVQNMLLQAYELGVGSLVVSAITRKNALRKLLDIPSCYEPMCFVLFGVSDEEPFTPPRREIGDFVHLNKFGNLMSERKRLGALYPNSPNPSKWNWTEYKEFKKTIVHYAGPLGMCEPIGINSLTMNIFDIVCMKIKSKGTKRILDLFPCDGLFLRSVGWRISPAEDRRLYAVEASEENAEYVEHVLKKDELQVQVEAIISGEDDRPIFPFKDRTFDAVTCFFRLESAPNRLDLLRESIRVLKDDGVIFVAFFNKWGAHEGIRKVLSLNKPNNFNRRWHWLIGPWDAPSRKSLERELMNVGFRFVAVTNFYDLASVVGLLFAKLSSVVGISSLSRRFSYSSPVEERGFLPSIILIEAQKKGPMDDR